MSYWYECDILSFFDAHRYRCMVIRLKISPFKDLKVFGLPYVCLSEFDMTNLSHNERFCSFPQQKKKHVILKGCLLSVHCVKMWSFDGIC